MRYKTRFPKGEEEPIEWDDILQHRNHRLLVEKIQQSNWEKAGRDWKVYLSNIEWDNPPIPSTSENRVKKLTELHPFQKFL